ncbi:hypothetical protein [Tsukamurella sp. 1534]|uniref:hypothetical protein n=1 Tax=Tsukamurella sp. 1534 TaxID=1151061 RepID=UPI0002FDC763|nr:hypothetical protein [Tsukamurella sp. 1534]
MSTIAPYMNAAERLYRAEQPNDSEPDTVTWVRNMAAGRADPDAPAAWPRDRTMMHAAEVWMNTMWPRIEGAVRRAE